MNLSRLIRMGRIVTGLGFTDASQVRIGKQTTLDIDAEDSARAEQRAARMCESLLANTVIEDYSIEVIDAS